MMPSLQIKISRDKALKKGTYVSFVPKGKMTPTKARTLTLQEHLHNQLQQLIAVDFPNVDGKGEVFSAYI